MNSSNTAVPGQFRCLITQLQSPVQETRASPPSPYPWPDEEMIARYGMRYPTPAERNIFPTHRLVINVVKARIRKIGKSPYVNAAGIGAIVWAVESYPGSHQFRIPNGDLLHEQLYEIEWEQAPDDMPVTTLASIERDRLRQQWRQKVQQGIRQSLPL